MSKAKAPAPLWPWDALELPLHELSLLKAIPDAAIAVIEKLAGNRNPFTAGGEDGRRATDFACGKLWLIAAIRNARAQKLPQPRGPRPGPHDAPKGAPPADALNADGTPKGEASS